MRADRLLSILLLLQVHRRLTARELAERMEVSERTIHRDMEALGSAGVAVTAQRGSGGGWMLLEEYRTNLTGLSETEIQALFLSRPTRLLADLGLHQASEAAQIKLMAALPLLARHEAESARGRVYIAAPGWQRSKETDAGETTPWLPTLQQAIRQERKLHFTYRRSDDSASERICDPLGLVARGKIWYLVAAQGGEMRTYRVSRVQTARVMDEPCCRPPAFDLAAYWEESVTQFRAGLPCYPVTVRVAPTLLPRVPLAWKYAKVVNQASPDAEGWTTLGVEFELEEYACESLLGAGPQVVVIEPQGLREKLIRLAEQVLGLYARNDAPQAR